MKSPQELQQFYQSDLLPALEVLEKQRRAIVRKAMIAIFVVGGLALVVVFAVLASGSEGLPILFFVGVGAVGGCAVLITYFSRGYVGDFKHKIIRPIVTWLEPSLAYEPQNCISESTYLGSGLFPRRPDRYSGDDLVRGQVGRTEIVFSELHSEYKTQTRDSKGRTQTHWHTIFRGLFFIADFNKHFAGRTIVLPDVAESLFGKFGQTLQGWNFGRGDLVKLEDAEFEREFVVYGTDQVEARYILSTSLMRRITDFKRTAGRYVHLSFVNSCVYVAIRYERRLFEPRLFRTLLDMEPIGQYVEDLQLALGIVEDLNLNTRIWSKA